MRCPRLLLLPAPRLGASRKRGLAALLAVVCWLLSGAVAQAQIVRENPGQLKAANRRALREAQRTESPYKDSHLRVTPARLKRGASTQFVPEGSKRFRFEHGKQARVVEPRFPSLRRKKE